MEGESPNTSQWELLEKEDTLQFFKEEKVDGAVYNVYLKKVRYHSSNVEDVGIRSPNNDHDGSRSRFYRNFPGNDEEDDGKARLQWRLQEVKVVKCGVIEKLVEALGSETGDIDSNYVNTFLATFRTFATVPQVLKLLLTRYRQVGDDSSLKQHHKEGHTKSLRTVLSLWLVHFTDDFDEPPHYPSLHAIHQFAEQYIPDSDIAQRAHDQLNKFIQEDESCRVLHVEDITLDIHLDSINENEIETTNYLVRPVTLLNTPSYVLAQQLTYVDAELFRKVIPHHCLGSVWSRRDKKRGEAASVYATVNQFNAVSYRVIATILKHPYLPPVERVEIIEKWIDIAQELRQLKNFSSLKAIISGLQSNPVYRLQRVWAEVERDRMSTFKDLAEIFSEDNNQFIARELLNREGTAKFADPESTGTIKGHGRQKSGSGWGTTRSRKSQHFTDSPLIATGTIPYLGTFLTDLTMVDTAMKDTTSEGLINFDKKRKEFEILAQIKMLQAAAHMYRIKPEPAFFEWFHSTRVYDDNESYELSCEIEPVTPSTPKELRGHRKKSSLGFFTPRRPASMTLEGLFRFPSSGNIAGDDAISVISAPELEHPVRGLTPSGFLKHSVSSGSLSSLTSQDMSPWKHSECLIVKVFLETIDSDTSSNYKSIMVSNSDHTQNVVKTILLKFNLVDRPDHFILYQVLPDKEIQLPDRGNIFYAICTSVPDLRFVMRRKTEMDRIRSRKYNKAKLYKFTV